MKITVFCDVTSCLLVMVTDISEELAASIFKAVEEEYLLF
jgi:hypothetical protein